MKVIFTSLDPDDRILVFYYAIIEYLRKELPKKTYSTVFFQPFSDHYFLEFFVFSKKVDKIFSDLKIILNSQNMSIGDYEIIIDLELKISISYEVVDGDHYHFAIKIYYF